MLSNSSDNGHLTLLPSFGGMFPHYAYAVFGVICVSHLIASSYFIKILKSGMDD